MSDRNFFERGKVFRDPIHGLIPISEDDDVLIDLVATPEFQRLRRVRQLGVSWMTYPGAEHSRFVHSLGVLSYAQRIIGALLKRYPRGSIHAKIQEHAREVKAAALLHDIGHGPFSHVAERAFGRKGHHESRTISLIDSTNSGVHEVLARHGMNTATVKAIIGKTYEFPFLQDIVSSQLDADRMDYILRDAHCSGVRYGAFDSEWIINSLCLGLDPAAEKEEEDVRELRLCLESRRGLHSAEQLIISRFHMSMQVYFHRATRGWEAHLLMLLNNARSCNLPASTPRVVKAYVESGGEITEGDFLFLDDMVVTAAISEWAASTDKELALVTKLANAFLRREKILRVRELTVDEARADRRILLQSKLERRLGQQNQKWLIDYIPFELYKFFGPLASSSVDENAQTDAILISDGSLNKYATPFESHSILFGALNDRPGSGENKKRVVCRLYYLPEVAEGVEAAFVDLNDPLVEFKS